MNDKKDIVIGYWNARGLIEPIKFILEYLKLPYRVDIPKCGPAPYYNKVEWYQIKYEYLKGFDFPNLPYFDDGERKLTHLFTIMEYIGMKHSLYPTQSEIIDASLIREQIKDILWLEMDYIYFYEHRSKGIEPTIEEKKAARSSYIAEVSNKVKELSQKYNSKWMVGDRLTFLDFIVYEYLDHIRILGVECLQDNLKNFMVQFEHLPNIKEFKLSERFKEVPLYAERSYIGRSVDDWKDHA